MIRKVIGHYREAGFSGLLRTTNNYIRNKLTPYYMEMLEHTRKPEKKIIFCNFAGKGYGGYPAAICDELLRRRTDAKLIWLSNKDAGGFPEHVRTVRVDSYAALRELATAKVWIDNCRKGRKIRKSDRQFYLQTWHGGGPCLKMIEGDAQAYLPPLYMEDAKHDTEMADLFISDCEWQNDNYRRAFWYNGEILNCTTPPNDFFYQDWDKVKKDVFRAFGLDTNKHIILYAPTFRNNHSTDCYDIDYDRILSTCRKRFGGEWVFVVRMHPTMTEKQAEIRFNDRIINGTSYPQIEEILIASDILITDFSASMFLAFRWKIISFLYANDYEDYIRNERPLYFDIKELPSGFSGTNDELEDRILNFSQEDYRHRCEMFNQTVGFFEGGQSVKIITDRIEFELSKNQA